MWGGVLKAVVSFGSPASPSLCKGVAGKEYFKQVIELNRLCREDDFKQPLSKLVSYGLKDLKKYNLYVVSFSDTAMNHHGYIYQACNFFYTGCTKERTDKYTEGNKHSRHYDNNNQIGRKIRSAKHRYIYICASSKKIKKEMLDSLKYPILNYPKGDNNKDYALGYVLQQKVILSSDIS